MGITISNGAACPLRMFLDGMEVFGDRFIDHGDWWELLPDKTAPRFRSAHQFHARPVNEQRRPRRNGRP